MTRVFATAAAFFLSAAVSVAFAQTDVRVESQTRQTGPGRDVKVKSQITTGTVKEYEAGRKIKLSGPAGKTYAFDLDGNARVDGAIAVGQRVKVEWTKDANGKERVTVLSGPGSTRGAAETAMLEKPAEGQAAHRKTETTVHRAGPDVKTTTETVIGTVKDYEPGKRITVTGPKGDVSFGLGDGVELRGKVVVGARVQVEYTKEDDGTERVRVVSLVSGKSTPAN